MNEQNISFSIKNVNAPCIIGTQKAAILTIENECICIEKKKAEKKVILNKQTKNKESEK